MKYFYAILLLLLALFLAAFIQQNSTGIQLKYFYWSTVYLPISLYMILCFFAGYVVAVLVGFTSGLRTRFRASGAERELRQVRSELEQLKKAQLEAVSSELQAQTPGPHSQDDENTRAGNEKDDELTRHDYDPDAETAITGSGGEKEK